MHPVIRVAAFLVLVLALSRAGLLTQVMAAALVLLGYLATATRQLLPAARMLRRLRWLLLSILVIYLWFTPGTPLVLSATVDARYLPTWEGLQTGLLRVTALVTVVLAVNLLLETTPREGLLAALIWMTRPLQVFGLSREKLAVRLLLVMDAVPEMAGSMRQQTRQVSRGSLIRRAGSMAAGLVETALARAEQAQPQEITLSGLTAPPVWQWIFPVLLLLGLIATA